MNLVEIEQQRTLSARFAYCIPAELLKEAFEDVGEQEGAISGLEQIFARESLSRWTSTMPQRMRR
jgi:hypothetical protein